MSDAGDMQNGFGGDFDNEGGEGGTYTETTEESYGDRLKGACAGICIGIILFFGSFPLLFWNEGRAVERYDALHEGEERTVSVSAKSIDPANEGKLLHLTVDVFNGGGNITDSVFGIKTMDGLKLRREAEMYQWDESVSTSTNKKTGGKKETTKEYSYHKKWSSSLISSSGFKRSGYKNPAYMRFETEVYTSDIQIGAFQLPAKLVDRIQWYEPLSVSLDDITDQSLRTEAKTDPSTGGFYFGNSTSSPAIGDQRVWFSQAPPSTVTIVGVQDGNTLSAYVADSGEGGEILLFKQGNYTAAEMYEAAEAENAALSWILRFVGFAVMALGLYLCFRPIEVFADFIPCVGSIIGCGIAFMAVLIAAILSTVTISIAWLVAHPMIGGIVLAVTLAFVTCVAFCVKKVFKKNSSGDDDSSSSSSDEEDGDIWKEKSATTAGDDIPVVQGSVLEPSGMTAVQQY